MKRWAVPALVTLALVVLAATTKWWLPLLLGFVGTNTDLIQGLTDLVQLALWIGTGIAALVGLWRGKGEEFLGSERVKAIRSILATRGGVAGGTVAVGRDVQGDVIVVADPDLLWQAIRRRSPSENIRQATKHYLTYLVDRYRYLDFKGMGVSARVPLRLSLLDMYVPLKARIELPKGETWTRELRVAGREVPAEERAALGERLSEPRPTMDLLQENDCLIILGDPGAGKTTFLKYLVLKLASGDSEDLGLGERLPVLIPLSAYANVLAKRDVRLDDFVARYFHDLGADLPIEAMLEEALKEGGALVLLDGLDEVKEEGLRRTVVERTVDFYAFHRRAGNRFVLTSRLVGYREVRPTAAGLAECTLTDFSDEEIEEFVDKWTVALEKAARGKTPVAALEAEREQRELLQAVNRNPGVRRLAANPLLLTILALMKRQGMTLPDRRVELYDQYVRTLLSSWNRARGLGRPPARDLDVVETVRILAPLALWMHEVDPGVGLVKQGDLKRKLVQIYQERGEKNPEQATRQFLDDVREHAGLLLERGAGRYGFIHLTFEEYLAAMGIARLGQRKIEPIVKILAQRVSDPAWREVTLLTIGYLGVVQQWEEVASDVVGALIAQEPGKPGQAAALVGEAVADAWPGGVTPACKEAVVQILVPTLRHDYAEPTLRAAAGRALARLGDPRPGVGLRLDGLPDIAWCDVSAGPFLMGSDKAKDQRAYDRELPQHKVTLPAYRISKYPVTNAQYAAFVVAGGYEERHYWTATGWRWKGNRTGPKKYGGVYDLSNHPVVMVTWYEAVAFCHWLTERLRETGKVGLGEEVRLPSEAEWEKAARGPEGRVYSWGDDTDPNRAHYGETGIGTTSAVGCFSGGASPYGVEDMSGNVWEWCRTKWQESYRDYRDDNELEDEATRVLRGGAFYGSEGFVRCASRLGDVPNFWDSYVGFRVVVAPGPLRRSGSL
jgi:formylglycine-generating enzyme required for sulfatase activity